MQVCRRELLQNLQHSTFDELVAQGSHSSASG